MITTPCAGSTICGSCHSVGLRVVVEEVVVVVITSGSCCGSVSRRMNRVGGTHGLQASAASF